MTSGRRGRFAVTDPQVYSGRSDPCRAAKRVGAEDGDIVFFGADTRKVVNDALGALRNELGADLGLIEPGYRPCWVVDWPMFERTREVDTALSTIRLRDPHALRQS